jgi:hypothetical protein
MPEIIPKFETDHTQKRKLIIFYKKTTKGKNIGRRHTIVISVIPSMHVSIVLSISIKTYVK